MGGESRCTQGELGGGWRDTYAGGGVCWCGLWLHCYQARACGCGDGAWQSSEEYGQLFFSFLFVKGSLVGGKYRLQCGLVDDELVWLGEGSVNEAR